MSQEFTQELYVTGSKATSKQAIKNLKEITTQESDAFFEIGLIDLTKNAQLTKDDEILAVCNLIRISAIPTRKIILYFI